LRTISELMLNALRAGRVIPGFNIGYLPMMLPVVHALRDTRCFGLVMVARLEWTEFEAKSLAAIREEYERVKAERYTRLHLDHVPVIDEDNLRVDYHDILSQAVELGYDSIMIDGSRLPLAENIAATRGIVEMAHRAGVAVEAELGAVMGHEASPLPPYEELFASGKGFTDPAEARQFVEETRVDWLSIAIGSVHGAIVPGKKEQDKIQARLNIDQLKRIREAANIPLVLHGGTGIPKSYIMQSIREGIAKINIATAIRQPFERLRSQSLVKAIDAVYDTMISLIDDLEIRQSAAVIDPEEQ
jgi:ketose-bisphosphate aldolase